MTASGVQAAVVFLASMLASCGEDAARKPGDSRLDGGGEQAADAAIDSGGDAFGHNDLIASADGDDAAPGTLARPTTLTAALERITAGGTVYLRGGTYEYSTQLTIARDNHGSANARKTLSQYQREAPRLEFSEQPYGAADNLTGLQIDGSYWHVVGVIVRGAAGAGIYVSGSHNVIERCATFQNRGTGLQLGAAPMSGDTADRPSDNLVLDCESFDNYDAPPGAAESADGFAARAVGRGNVFRGCVSHHNIGDGFDLDAEAPITIDQSVAHTNCVLSDGTHNAQKNCSGFKLGGEGAAGAHVVARSVAYYNDRNGFTWNGNRGAIRLINTLAFDNSQGNYEFGAASTAVFDNNVSLWLETAVAKHDAVFGQDAGGSNRFWLGESSGVVAADFANMLHNVKLTRTLDGDVDFSAFALAPTSALIDSGALPSGPLPFDASYYHGAPDLGAVETP